MFLPLPQEIIDTIITSVDDQDGLRQCALVCRAWTPICHRRLFRHFHILIRDSDPLSCTSTGLLRYRLQKYPHLAGCIEKLSIEYDSPCAETSRQEQQLSIIILKCFHLVELSLLCEPDRGFLFDVDFLLLEALRNVLASPRLKHVTIDGWDFDDLSHFISLMGTSVNGAISTLELGRIHFNNHTPAIQRQKTGPLVTLNSLVVSMDSKAADTWFASLGHPLGVKRLELADGWTNSVTHLLARFSSTIEEIIFNFRWDLYSVDVDFSKLIRLSKLTLNLDLDQSVLHALLHTLPDSVEALELLLESGSWDEAWFMDTVTFLDEFLASRQFARLKKVTLNLWHDPCCLVKPLRFFRRNMARAVGKGIVCLNVLEKAFNSSDIRGQDCPSDGAVSPCPACRDAIADEEVEDAKMMKMSIAMMEDEDNV